MKRKKRWIAAIAVIALFVSGYHIYRYPVLTDAVENKGDNDIVFVGHPVWWNTILTPINTFLKSYDPTGKFNFESLPTYSYRQQEIELKNQGQRIYGIAAYCFDFRGGGGTMSDGDTTEMSVMTEVSDLEVILKAAAGWDFVDVDKMVLLGTSQGGIASAIAAARHADKVSGLVLMYPAFLVSDAIHEQFDSLDEVPDTFYFNWITAGRPYAEDMWDYDVYAEIGNYTEKVLLMHGDRDGIVPISYSERAAAVYEDVDYFVIDGAGHGFSGSEFEEAVRYIFDYLQEIQVI